MSIATVVKFISMISTTGRKPTIEAPIAAPIIACSDIGVERTLLVPNLVDRPLLTPNTPPPSQSAKSSPKAITFSSAASASCSARFTPAIRVTGFSSGIIPIAPHTRRFLVQVRPETATRRQIARHHLSERRFQPRFQQERLRLPYRRKSAAAETPERDL